MLGSARPSTATIQTSTSSATPTSPTRPSRLRGLSYLRNYTHSHLHPERTSSRAETPPLRRATSTPASDSPTPAATRAASLGAVAAITAIEERRTEPGPAAGTPTSTIQSGENGWVPTVQGRSGLNREGANLTSTSTDSAAPEPSASAASMTRHRVSSSLGPTPAANATTAMRRASAVEPSSSRVAFDSAITGNGGASSGAAGGKDSMPTIRLIPHVETRSTRPSLHFSAISRTLKNPSAVVKVGRYSERDNATADETSLPVGFKSKVVSRRHCEFWCTNGQWYVKDVKSSSGTFLNHVRLSSPGVESRPYPVNDGDVVQLGIDFKGGEEIIFRCVKIRIECNRGWQKSLNNFNTTTHKQLLKTALGGRTGARNRDSDAASVNTSECSICLNPVAPCQALFVAPCSHVWHFKCVKNLIQGSNYPNFLCPNCRFVADLEADVEPPEEEEDFEALLEQLDEDPPLEALNKGDHDVEGDGQVGTESRLLGEESRLAAHETGSSITTSDAGDGSQPLAPEAGPYYATTPAQPTGAITDDELTDLLDAASLNPAEHTNDSGESTRPSSSLQLPLPAEDLRDSSRTPPVAIRQPPPKALPVLSAMSATPTSSAPFALAAGVLDPMTTNGPMTPRNNEGPFVFNGSAGSEAGDVSHGQEEEQFP